jgi:hypothetical protein
VRADGWGGFAVLGTDNLGGLALGDFEFSPSLESPVYPVPDIHEGTGPLAEAAEFRKSIS